MAGLTSGIDGKMAGEKLSIPEYRETLLGDTGAIFVKDNADSFWAGGTSDEGHNTLGTL